MSGALSVRCVRVCFGLLAVLSVAVVAKNGTRLATKQSRATADGRPPRYRTLYACEGSSLEIVCEDATHVHLIRANFGRFSISVCNDNGNVEWSVDCMSHRSFRVMQESCGMKRSCILPASSSVFGDPCPGTLKYLEAHYQCMPDYPQSSYSTSRPHHLMKNPFLSTFDANSENYHKTQDNSANTSPNPPIIFPESYNPSVIAFPAIELSNDKETDNSESVDKKTNESLDDNYAQVYDNYPPSNNNNNNDISPNVPVIRDLEGDEEPKHDDQLDRTPPPTPQSDLKNLFVYQNELINNTRADHGNHENAHNNDNNNFRHFADLTNDYCAQNYSRGLFWNWTLAGQTAAQACPGGARGVSRWSCTRQNGSPKWTPSLPDMSECSSYWIANLETRTNSGTESVVSLAEELAKNCRERILFGGDLFRATDILGQLVLRMENAIEDSNNHRSHVVKELLNSVQDVISNLLDDNQIESWHELSHNEQRIAVISMMHMLERMALLLADSKTQSSDYIRAYNNIFMSIHVRSVSSINYGLHLPPVPDSLDSAPSVADISNSVHLGQQSLIEQSTSSGLVKVVFLMYKKMAQFLRPETQNMDHYPVMMTADGAANRHDITRIINSDIIGILLNREIYTPLIEPLEFTLRHTIVANVSNARCVYWHHAHREWAQEGCLTVASNETHTSCQCNHLTHFAILMDISDVPISPKDELVLRLITYIGCTISIICLIVTLITLISFRSLKSDRNTIHTNLCLCLIIAETIFLLGISQTQNKLVCGLIAIFLHYFFLSAFLWMFFEGFQLYVMLIEVFDHERSRLNWYYLLSYGVPAIMVIISAIIDPLSYGTPKHCWLRSDNYFIWCFVGPVIAILAANLVFLAIAITTMCKHISHIANKSKEQTKLNTSNGENVNIADMKRINFKVWIRGSLALVVLLGLTWTFGILYLSHETLFMAYLFTITNSLQGLFIFVFTCLTNEKVRDEYRKLLSLFNLTPVCLEKSHSKSSDTCREQIPCALSPEQRTSLYANNSQSSNTKDSSLTTTTSSTSNSQPLISNCSTAAVGSFNDVEASGGSGVASMAICGDTPTMRRASQKYYLTDDSSDYGCKRLEQSAYHKQWCRDLYALHGHHSHASHPPSFIEHIYECIDEDPYVAKLLLPAIHRSLDGQHVRTLSDSSRHSDNRPLISAASRSHNYTQSSVNGHLPAIVRDNTANKTTIICSSQPSVALLNGDQVLCCTLSDHQLSENQTINHQLLNKPNRHKYYAANSLNNLNSLPSKSHHLSSDC